MEALDRPELGGVELLGFRGYWWGPEFVLHRAEHAQRGVPVLPVVEDLEEGVLPPRCREQDPLHTRHHCWAPPSRHAPPSTRSRHRRNALILGLSGWHSPVTVSMPVTARRIGTHLHDHCTHGHHAEPDRPKPTGGTKQKARSQPCGPKRPPLVDPRPTHCDAQPTGARSTRIPRSPETRNPRSEP